MELNSRLYLTVKGDHFTVKDHQLRAIKYPVWPIRDGPDSHKRRSNDFAFIANARDDRCKNCRACLLLSHEADGERGRITQVC